MFPTRRHALLLQLLLCAILLHPPDGAGSEAYGLDSRPVIGPFLNHAVPEMAPAISGKWSAKVAFTNLVFTNAIGLTQVPGVKRLCVWEREGRAWTFENSPDARHPKLMLDISSQCQGWDDSGLLGIAFHPGFATNHFVYVYYTWVQPGSVVGSPTTRPDPTRAGAYHDRLSRFTIDSAGAALPDSELVLVDQAGNTVLHNGGGLFFHPTNGFLYWTDGDDAEIDNTQVIDQSLFSGVFRIDVDKRGGSISHPIPRQPANAHTGNYYIPNDNPFVGQPGVLEEFFCLGLRNPYRMTCDPITGRIFIGDVGESSREEVDVIEPGESGLNFQWSLAEGTLGELKPPYIGKSRRPILEYAHSDGRAVIGGYVYRGKEFAADLGGKYIFGDNVLRTVWSMDESSTPPGKILLCAIPKGQGPNSGTDYTGLSSFGIDEDGEIYMCQMSSVGGSIWKLGRAGAPPPSQPVPPLLSMTGVFTDLPASTPAPGLIPYTVNSPLWSDGSVKFRWIALPANSAIRVSPSGEWTFPAGTVFVKTFALPVSDTNPTLLRRLETRLIVRDTNGFVYGASYRWRPDLTDAALVSTGMNEAILIGTASGMRTQQWFYPGRQDCIRCHTPASGGVLGVKTSQLNCDFAYPSTGKTDNQLRSWNHLGLFDLPLDETQIPHFAKLVAITNTSASLETRVRSYLDANCSNCHRPGGAHSFFDARIGTPLEKAGIINGPVENRMNMRGAKVVAPDDLARSLLYRRANSIESSKMPPLARNTVDETAMTMLASWINSLPPQTEGLPAPWLQADIGIAQVPGEASYLNSQFYIVVAGFDIWGKSDSFHYTYQSIQGDSQITLRIASLQHTDPWAKAGVMLRETSKPDSTYAAVLVTPANGAFFQYRPAEGAASMNTEGPNMDTPCWVRLVRKGNTVAGFISQDGQSWNKIGDSTIALPPGITAGIALASHKADTPNSALFDSVTIEKTHETQDPR